MDINNKIMSMLSKPDNNTLDEIKKLIENNTFSDYALKECIKKEWIEQVSACSKYDAENIVINTGYNEFKIFRYLLSIAEKHNIKIESYKYMKGHMKSACYNNDLKTITEIIEECSKYLVIDDGFIYLHDFVDICCYKCNLELLNYFSELSKNDKYKMGIFEWNFSSVCRKGNLEFFKYLFKLKYDINPRYGVNTINFNMGKNFSAACYSGNLELVKYLLELSKDCDGKITIRITHDNDEPFKNACKSNNVKLVKYLLKIDKDINGKITIDVNHDKLFMYLCRKRKMGMVKFLCSINDRYSYKINEDGKMECIIKYIY